MSGTALQSVGAFVILSYTLLGLLNFVPAIYNVLSIIENALVLAYALPNPSLSDNDFDGVIACCFFFCETFTNKTSR